MQLNSVKTTQRIKAVIFFLSLLPLVWYTVGIFADTLGANPIETITRGSGDWALRFLLITLTVTPLRKITGWNWLIRYRRMLGLFSFFYAALHFITYIWLDKFFEWQEIFADIVERPFITAGFVAFIILIPLASTSTNAMMRRLKHRWILLHKWVYVSVIAAILHFWWMRASKADLLEPMLYTAILIVLFGIRLKYRWERQRATNASTLESRV